MVVSEISETFPRDSLHEGQHVTKSVRRRFRIVRNLDIAFHSLHRETNVPWDEPLFEPSPPMIRVSPGVPSLQVLDHDAIQFAHYHGMEKLSMTLSLRNKDTVSRRVQVLPPQVDHFKVHTIPIDLPVG